MSDDWLDLPVAVDQEALLRQELSEDLRGSELNPVAPEGVDPEYAEAIKLVRSLRPRQRTYIRAYMASNGKRAAAIRKLEDAFVEVDKATVSRWHKSPKFTRALELVRKLLLRSADIDPVSLMLRAGEVIEHSLTPQPRFSREGHEVGSEIDANSAMRGIEWLGKVHRMTEDDKSVRVTFEMVNIADRDDAIDVTPDK